MQQSRPLHSPAPAWSCPAEPEAQRTTLGLVEEAERVELQRQWHADWWPAATLPQVRVRLPVRRHLCRPGCVLHTAPLCLPISSVLPALPGLA